MLSESNNQSPFLMICAYVQRIVTNAAFVNMERGLIKFQLRLDQGRNKNYSTLVSLGAMGLGIEVRIDILPSRLNKNSWNKMLKKNGNGK